MIHNNDNKRNKEFFRTFALLVDVRNRKSQCWETFCLLYFDI